jgi:hypothetical protein
MTIAARDCPAYAVIIRAMHSSDPAEKCEAFGELYRRGIWMTDEQRKKAGWFGDEEVHQEAGEPKP